MGALSSWFLFAQSAASWIAAANFLAVSLCVSAQARLVTNPYR